MLRNTGIRLKEALTDRECVGVAGDIREAQVVLGDIPYIL